jgi:glycosyltransferase involved in cell wall biosynthesis
MSKSLNSDTFLIVPLYNEAAVVEDVLKNMKTKFSNIVCVDDGSRDDSASIASKCNVMVVKHPINMGQGAAIQTGVDYALQYENAQYFITIDSDGQHSVDEANEMLNFLKKNNLDIVLGSRFKGQAKNISQTKKFFLSAAAKFTRITTRVNVTDAHNGLRVFNRNFAKNLNIKLHDFSHASEIIHRIGEGNFKYSEFPVTITYTDYSKSKGQPMLNSVNIIFDLLFNRISK